MRKVLLVTPPYHCGVVESAGTWLPLAFVYLAGTLRAAGYDVEIYDAMSKFHGYEEIAQRLEQSKPDVVASGAITATINEVVKVLALAKEINPRVVTVVGGVHAHFCWQEILEKHHGAVDFVVRGEGEQALPELLDAVFAGDTPAKVRGTAYWDGDAAATRPRPLMRDLDSLPRAWDLIEWPDYTYRPSPGSRLAIVSFARGCVQKCSFCSQQLFWEGQWRCRSPENFVDELEYLRDNFGVSVVMIADEAPATNSYEWNRILDLLIERQLGVEILMETRVVDIVRDAAVMDRYRAAGIVHVYVGVESGSQQMLDIFNKNIEVNESAQAIKLINDAGMISETSFVLGMPGETPETIRQTVKLAKYYNPDLAFFLAIAPWPYADLYDQLKPHIEVWDYSKYNLVEPVVKPINMTREELSGELFNAFGSFYISKLKQIARMPKFKRDYMMAVGHLLATHSYLAEHMPALGKMSAKMHSFLAG